MTVVSPTAVIRNVLNNRADRALSRLEARTCHSWKMSLDRAGVLPPTEDLAGHASFHLFIREGANARVTDLDGNRFIDLCMGFGAHILGHGTPAVQEAVAAQAARGWNFGLGSDLQLTVARRIQAASAMNERVVFCASGSDATAYAMRAARAHTGRDMIGVFSGSLHGCHDYGRVGQGLSKRRKRAPGIPMAVVDTTVSLTYGDTSAFDHICRRRRDLAAVIVEPVRACDPTFEHAHWLRALANVCGENGVLLIFDERLTGFRLAYGGAQERLKLMPDLVAYGEILGGGLPLGAVAGRSDIMEPLAEQESDWPAAADRGFSGNALSIAASGALLERLWAERGTLYPALEEATNRLASDFNQFAKTLGVPVSMRTAGSMFRIRFGAGPMLGPTAYAAAKTAFYALVLSKGVFIHASRLCFLSAAHTPADIDHIAAAFRESLADVNNDGLFALQA